MLKYNILLADDEPQIRYLIRRIINNATGINSWITEVSSGADAIAKIDIIDFDLVITEIHMGGKSSGIDVLMHARSLVRTPKVIIMTGHNDLKPALEAVKCAADVLILKPFTVKEMQGSISACLTLTPRATANHNTDMIRGSSQRLKLCY